MNRAGVGLKQRAIWLSKLLRGYSPRYSTVVALYRHNDQLLGGEYPEIVEQEFALQKVGNYGWDRSQFLRLRELRQLLDWWQPKRCFELGTGATTLLFNRWVAESADRKVISIEESSEWAEAVKGFFRPSTANHSLEIAAKQVSLQNGSPGCAYDFAPSEELDLVYVDGPGNECPSDADSELRAAAARKDDRQRLACLDVERLWKAGRKPPFIVVDGRLCTLRRWLQSGNDDYLWLLKSDYALLMSGVMPDYYLHHTVLIRRDAWDALNEQSSRK
jgi:hypothetical protein